MITKSEATAPEEKDGDKLRTGLYINSRLTGEKRASVTPEKRIPRKKINIKSLATSPPINDTIPNQDKNTLVIQKYQCLPSHVPPFPLGFKSSINEVDDDNPETTDTSRTDKYDMSCTNTYDSIENLEATKNINDNDE